MGLTVKRIVKKLPPGRYLDQHGLYLQVGPTGSKSWLLRYARNGRERWMGLGALYDFNRDEARERARKARQLLKDGVDPLSAKREEAAARKAAEATKVTFREAAEKYFADHQTKWRPPSRTSKLKF